MVMKESGIEWVGLIPDDWKIAKNNRLFNISKQLVNENWKNTQLLSLTKSGIIEKNINDGGGKQPESFGTYQYVEKDDIVLCLFDIDVSAVFSDRSKYDGMISPAYRIMKCTDAILPVYAKWWFDAVNIGRYYLIYTKSLRKTIDADGFGNILTVVPPLSEQQAIADYLDETCSKIDEIIAEAKASIDEYKELKQSVIFEIVTKGLDKNVEMKDSGVKAIGKVNNKYNVAKIAELNDGLTDGTHGTYERFDSGKLLLSSKNVQHNGLIIGDNESYISEADSNSIVANGFPQKDDLLLCCIGASIGRCILYPFEYPIAFQRSVIFIRCNKWILPKMMMYNLQSPSSIMQEQMIVNVSAQAGLYQGLVKQLYVVVPPINEQEQIILYLDKRTAEIDSLISEKQSLIQDLEAYKKSLIYEVVTGKRRVV